MPLKRFLQCYLIVLRNEGGFSDHPHDRGGRTKGGVTQITYNRYRMFQGLPIQDVSLITPKEHKEIYWQYWREAHCAKLPSPLDLQVFDAVINHGACKAVKLLQKVIGVQQDGLIGPKTLDAVQKYINTRDMASLVNAYLDARQEFYDQIVARDPSQKVFAKGWANRVAFMRGFYEKASISMV